MVLPVRPPALLVMRRATGLWIVGDGWQRFSGLATKPVEWPQFQISAETSPDDASARFDCQRKRDRNLPWLFGSAGLELNMPDNSPASQYYVVAMCASNLERSTSTSTTPRRHSVRRA